ncbi:MAG: 3-isopropylmalate dehydratase large subunit [Synergistaceae bacterium]|nr:3-isopropylmalate dehydratase large subunit [Synergistaceae bacterium]
MDAQLRHTTGMTITERILARAGGLASVRPGDMVDASVDRAMIHDNNAALVMDNFEKIIDPMIWAPERVAMFIDHHSPSTSVKASGHHARTRSFAARHGISRLYDCGQGISHIVMLEENLAGPGELVVGTDSHTTGEGARGAFATGIGATEMAAVLVSGHVWLRVPETIKIVMEGTLPNEAEARDLMNVVLSRLGPDGANYRAVEFHGSAGRSMSLEERAMCCVMSMEMGAKNAVFADAAEPPERDAAYGRVETFRADETEPCVAVPPLPTNACLLREVERERIKIDQAYIGSCAGGLLRDMAAAADVLKNRHAAPGVRLLVIPASRRIYAEALAKGYIATLHEAGAIIGSPACGACGGHDAGVLAKGEVCISDSPRNMEGRMGPGGTVYLAGAATVAASAVRGYISGKAGL